MARTTNKDLQVSIAELKTDLKYIKKSLESNEQKYEELFNLIQNYIEEIDNKLSFKADKNDLITLRNWFINVLIFVITLLLSVLGYLLTKVLNW